MNKKILIGIIITIVILTIPISVAVDVDRKEIENNYFDISVCIFTRVEGRLYRELSFIYPPSRIGFSAIIIMKGQDLKLDTLRGVELASNLIGFGFLGKITPCNETHSGQINGVILFGIHWFYDPSPWEQLK